MGNLSDNPPAYPPYSLNEESVYRVHANRCMRRLGLPAINWQAPEFVMSGLNRNLKGILGDKWNEGIDQCDEDWYRTTFQYVSTSTAPPTTTESFDDACDTIANSQVLTFSPWYPDCMKDPSRIWDIGRIYMRLVGVSSVTLKFFKYPTDSRVFFAEEVVSINGNNELIWPDDQATMDTYQQIYDVEIHFNDPASPNVEICDVVLEGCTPFKCDEVVTTLPPITTTPTTTTTQTSTTTPTTTTTQTSTTTPPTTTTTTPPTTTTTTPPTTTTTTPPTTTTTTPPTTTTTTPPTTTTTTPPTTTTTTPPTTTTTTPPTTTTTTPTTTTTQTSTTTPTTTTTQTSTTTPPTTTTTTPPTTTTTTPPTTTTTTPPTTTPCITVTYMTTPPPTGSESVTTSVVTRTPGGSTVTSSEVATTTCYTTIRPVTTTPATSRTTSVTTPPEECAITVTAWKELCGKPPQADGVLGNVGSSPFALGDVLGDGDLLELNGESCCGNCTCQDNEVVCTIVPCDCVLHEWADWSECTAECGGGYKTRTRDITPGDAGGDPCPCETFEREFCAITPCIVDGEWGPWAAWSDCTATCNGGISHRERKCDSPAPANLGDDCIGEPLEVKECNAQPCPADGICTAPMTSRPFTNPLSCYDASHPDALDAPEFPEEEACRCSGGFVFNFDGDCVPLIDCSCYNPYHAPDGPIFVGTTAYEGATPIVLVDGCTECTCTNGDLTCNDDACDEDCGYGEWSDWSPCTLPEDGLSARFREGNSPPAKGNGAACAESLETEYKDCNVDACVDQGCNIGGVDYAVGEIIPSESTDCGLKCYCGTDGQMQCEDVELECAPCADGYVANSDPNRSWDKCCECIPTPCEPCHSEVYREFVEYTNAKGDECRSIQQEAVERCEGHCKTSDIVLMEEGGTLIHVKDCKCCTGDPGSYRWVEADCGSYSQTIMLGVQLQCSCEQCTNGGGDK